MKNILITVTIMLLGFTEAFTQIQAPPKKVELEIEVKGGITLPTPYNDKFSYPMGYGGGVTGVFDDGGNVHGLIGLNFNAINYTTDYLPGTSEAITDVKINLNHFQIPFGVRYQFNWFFAEASVNLGFLVNSELSGTHYRWKDGGLDNFSENKVTELNETSLGFGLGCGLLIPIKKNYLVIQPRYTYDGKLLLNSETLRLAYGTLQIGWRF